MSLVELAAACTLQVALTTLQLAPVGWTETTRLEILAEGGTCAWVELSLPPEVQLDAWRGRIKRWDGPRQRLGEERLEPRPRALDGLGQIRLHTPDLRPGDRLDLRFTRQWRADTPWSWRPAPARHAELKAPASLEWEVRGEVRREGAQLAWASEAGPEDEVVLRDGQRSQAQPVEATLQPATGVEERWRVELRVPPGDPQVRLFPGGGASTRTDLQLRFPPGEAERGWVVPLPTERSELEWSARPADSARLIERDDSVVVAALGSEGPTQVSVGWTAPDAPTFGERAASVAELQVRAPGGQVAWEGDSWRLVGIHDRPVLPSREALLRALEHRFRAAAIPEPGLPNALRGVVDPWDAAAVLVDLLHERAVPREWSAEPLWPRRLIPARKSGAISTVEAALILWVYARQLGFDAQWVLVRPASAGPGAQTSPAGYTEALVRLSHKGEVRWLDPGCTQCGAFELRPELQGAAALAPGIERTPEPEPGRWVVEHGEDQVRWALQGAPALELRRWLAEIPAAERTLALATRMGGPSAEWIGAEGLDARGQRAEVTARPGLGAVVNPLQLPVPRDDGTVWVPWIGERQQLQPADAPIQATELIAGPLTWSLRVEGGQQIERLIVRDRLVDAADIHAIEAARRGALAPPIPPDPPEPDLPQEPTAP